MKNKQFLARYGHMGKLIDEPDHRIKEIIARNPSTSKEHLEKLVSDTNRDVHYAARASLLGRK